MDEERYEALLLELCTNVCLKSIKEWEIVLRDPKKRPDYTGIDKLELKWLDKQEKLIDNSFGRTMIETLYNPDEAQRLINRLKSHIYKNKLINE
jgi:hypothetical protein